MGGIDGRQSYSGTGEMSFPIQKAFDLLHQKSLKVTVRLRDMLQAMQQAAAAPPAPPRHSFAELLAVLDAPPSAAADREPAPSSRSFAELLASLDAPSSAVAEREPAWSDEGLADDYATLSYERALRAHARYRSADPPILASDFSLTQSADAGHIRIPETLPAAAPTAEVTATPQTASSWNEDVQPRTTFGLPTPLNRNLRSASITVRLSEAECAQLRKLAAEAGLTVSAYLRSCTFEAESLRAEVKDALAQLRSGSSRANRAKGDRAVAKQVAVDRVDSGSIRHSWRQWWKLFWPWAHSSRCMARA